MSRSGNGCVLAIIAVSLAASPATAAVRYVKAAASGANNGTSWTDAYTSLQQALVDAIAGDEIWVAVGTYKPSSPGGRASTFQLRNSIAIYGGFRGQSGDEGVNDATTRPPDPDPATANPVTDSILSGDLNGNDGPNFAGNGENVYHVVTGSGTSMTAVLDGFSITGGNANQSPGTDHVNSNGGGLFCDGGTPQIQLCRFISSIAGNRGGAAFHMNGSHASYDQCDYFGNRATLRGAGGAVFANASDLVFSNCGFLNNESVGTVGGGALFAEAGAEITLTGCTFTSNTATSKGGGLYLSAGDVTMSNCTFASNTAPIGGGILQSGGSATLTRSTFRGNAATVQGGAVQILPNAGPVSIVNCVFQGNSAPEFGGAVSTASGTTLTLTNCLLINNIAGFGGGGLYNTDGSATLVNSTLAFNSAGNLLGGGIHSQVNGVTTVRNSVIWYNTNTGASSEAQVHSESGASTTRTYSNVQGLSSGTGNIDANPRFVDANGPDNIFGTVDDDLRLAPFSRCIDAGRNSDVPADTADLDGDSNTAEATPHDLDGATGPGRFVNSSYICDTGDGSAPMVDMGAYENNGVWATPGVIFVSGSATGADNGTSWTNAYQFLQSALSAASDDEAACPGTGLQIWVARHNVNPPYHPSLGSGLSGGNRAASYSLVNNVKLYGGFAGGETLLSQRNVASPTRITGDWLGDGGGTDNSYHVFQAGPAINGTAVLDGFTIDNGRADGAAADADGGGLYNNAGSPTIANCVFTGHYANSRGGGIYSAGGNLRITSSTIQSSVASSGGGLYSGAGNPIISKSVIQNNLANFGGGIYTDSAIDIVNAVLRSNVAIISGGALLVGSATAARLTNCLLTNNAAQYGAGVYQAVAGGMTTIVNCSIVENRQVYYDCGTCYGVGVYSNNGTMILSNTILWGNRGLGQYTQWNQLIWGLGTMTTNRCAIQGFFGGISGSGCFGDDPRLRDPDGLNNVIGDSDDNLRLTSISPCIDRGNETLLPPDVADLDGDSDTTEPVPYDLAGNPRRYDVPDVADTGVGTPPLVDVGAYEFSMGDTYICIGGKCLGDLNHDGNIDGLDIPIFVAAVLTGAACP